MRKIFLVVAVTFIASSAFAAPTCDAPKEKWMKEADFKAKLTAEGYKIKTFKITKKNCYKVTGEDKGGKMANIFFNPETAAVLESK